MANEKDGLTVKTTTRSDGATSTVYGKESDGNGNVTGNHGHLVTKDGEVTYLRREEDSRDNPLVDTKK